MNSFSFCYFELLFSAARLLATFGLDHSSIAFEPCQMTLLVWLLPRYSLGPKGRIGHYRHFDLTSVYIAFRGPFGLLFSFLILIYSLFSS